MQSIRRALTCGNGRRKTPRRASVRAIAGARGIAAPVFSVKHKWTMVRICAVRLLLLVVTLGSGCRTRTPRSSYQILPPEEASFLSPASGPNLSGEATASHGPETLQLHRNPMLKRPARQPVYPPSAHNAGLADIVVYVAIDVDAQGNVTNISPSLRHVSVPNHFSSAFFDAITDAVSSWQFRPAEDVFLESTTERGETKNRFIRSSDVADTIEVKFTFTADGRVK